jgi:hypothetical protein
MLETRGRIGQAEYIADRVDLRRDVFVGRRVQSLAIVRPLCEELMLARGSFDAGRAELSRNLSRAGRLPAFGAYGVRSEHSALDGINVGVATKEPLAVGKAFCAAADLLDGVATYGFEGGAPYTKMPRTGSFAHKRGLSVRTREISSFLRSKSCSSVRREVRAESEASRTSRELESSVNGKASCGVGRDAAAANSDSGLGHGDCGVRGGRHRGFVSGIPLKEGNKGMPRGGSGKKVGESSASEFRSGLSARRQSRIQRANLASTSASAHLSRTSWASLRRSARRFRCANSNASRAGFEAVTRNSSCGWAGVMKNPPNSDPRREGGT